MFAFSSYFPAVEQGQVHLASEKQKIISLLNREQNKLIVSCHYDFERLASDSAKLGAFCTELLRQKEERCLHILSGFVSKSYSTVYSIKLVNPIGKFVAKMLHLLEKFPVLSKLSLVETDISDVELVALIAKGSCLKSLKIKECKKVTHKGFCSIGGGLQELSIAKSQAMDDEALVHILQACKNLQTLSCRGCPLVTFARVFKKNRVKALKIEACGITRMGLIAISDCFYSLKSITLRACSRLESSDFLDFDPTRDLVALELTQIDISEEVVSVLLSKIAFLSALILSDLPQLSAAFFSDRVKLFKDCSFLSLSQSFLSDSGLLAIKLECNRLRYLDISYCQAITTNGFKTGLYPQSIEDFNASGTEIDVDGAEALLRSCRNLSKIRVAHCEHLPLAAFQNWTTRDQFKALVKDNDTKLKPAQAPPLSQTEVQHELMFEIDVL